MDKSRVRGIGVAVLVWVALAAAAWRAPTAAGYTDLTGAYTWKPLKIGAGGWVVGMWVHPNVAGVVYSRSDVGGAYRWDEQTDTWANIVTGDSMPDDAYGAYEGVTSIVGAPSDANIAYMAFSRNVYRSTNQATTWSLPGTLDVDMAPNAEGRQEGERLAVDPADANVVYFGSVANGLWVTTNGGANWSQVAAVPVVTDGVHGINTVLFDPNSGTTGGKTNTIYVTTWGQGIWRTTNAGGSWSKISGGGGPADGLQPRDADVGPDGTFYVAYPGNQTIWKHASGSWTNISPGGQDWKDIAADPFNSQRLFATTSVAYNLWRSTNQGASWTQLTRNTSSDIDWQQAYYAPGGWMGVGEITFDPTTAGTLWFSEAMGVWRTTDLNDSNVTWYSVSRGIEDTCPNAIVCPATGHPVAAVWDLNGFYFWDPDAFTADQAHVTYSNAWSLDCCAGQPSFVAMISQASSYNVSGYSTNAGQNWSTFSSTPGDYQNVPRGVAVSATNPDNIVWWNSTNNDVWYTTNRGASWNPGNGFPGLPALSTWGWGDRQLDSDKVDGGTFYIYNWGPQGSPDYDGGVWRSTNGGANWTKVSTAVPEWVEGPIVATPGHAGHVWFCGCVYGDGTKNPLYRSTDYGSTWSAVSGTGYATAVGFGKAQGGGYPTIYMVGELDGEHGIWRSTDETATWAKIAHYPLGIYARVNWLAGDPDVFGKVYAGIDGKGFAYGAETGGDTTPPAAPTGLAATAAGENQIDLDWNDNSEQDLASYTVYRDTSSGGPYSQIASNVTQSQHSDTSCAGSTTYYYVVTAVDTSSNESTASNEASATTAGDTTPPADPTGLAATPGDATVSLDWADNGEGDLAGYRVYRDTSAGGPYSQIASPTASDHTDSAVTNGTSYYYVVTAVDTSSNESGYSNEASATPQGPTQDPYGGTPRPIPGVVQAEDYDEGGEGVAYHDADAGNNGGAYRSDDVDIEACGEGGYNTGWATSGEWMEYTVNVTGGTYDIDARVASTQSGRTFDILLDGAPLGTVNVPNTGAWQTYQTVTLSDVAVSGGNGKILRINLNGD
jgi:hypothetical protein